jgi:outer membrane protein assembly factor BamB
MLIALRKTFRLTVALLIFGCAGGAGNWGQFHGDLSSRGFQSVESGFALSAAWISAPFKITSSSPVIGKDFEGKEIIYIGTVDGRLIALKSEDGSLKWSRSFNTFGPDSRVVGSPAVSEKGDIYVISSHQQKDGKLRSTLHKVDPFGNTKWSYPFTDNGFTTGSPKVLTDGEQTFIFVHLTLPMDDDVQAELFVLQDSFESVALLDRKSLGVCRYGPAGIDLNPHDIIETMIADWEYLSSFPVRSGEGEIMLPDAFADPTPAIVATEEKVMVAIADNLCSLGVYDWDGEKLSVVWREEHNYQKHSSVALLPSGMVVFGRQDGKVFAFDAPTGVKMWEYDAGEPVFATPAAAEDQFIFVVSKTHIHVLNDETGMIIAEQNTPSKLALLGQTHASAAVTDNRVYVSTDELLTATYDLKAHGHDTNFSGNGLSSLAVGNKGDVFVVDHRGRVRKYMGTD